MAAKAYWCTPVDWDESSDVVFAENRSKAISYAISRGESCNECTFIEVRAIRCPAADKYANDQDKLRDVAVWREIGGCGDIGESRCDSCGLASMIDSGRDKWQICEGCNQCGECGDFDGLIEDKDMNFLCPTCNKGLT